MASDYNKTVTSRNSVNPANFSFNTGNIIGYPNKISSGSRSSSGGSTTNITLNLDELLTDNLEEGVTSEKIENPKAYEVLDENFTEGDSASYSKSSDFEKAAATVVECGFSFLKGFFKVGENILDGVVQLGSNIVVGVSEVANYLGADIDTQAIKDSTQAFVSTDYVGLAYEEVVGKNEWIQQNSQASDTALAIFEGAGTIAGYTLVNAIPGAGGSVVAAFGAAGSAAENAYQCGATYGEASVVAWVAGGTAFAMDAGLDKLGKAARGTRSLNEGLKFTAYGAGMGIVEPTVNYTTQYLTYANDQVDENGNPLYDNYLDYMATSGYLFEAGIGGALGAGTTGIRAIKGYNNIQGQYASPEFTQKSDSFNNDKWGNFTEYCGDLQSALEEQFDILKKQGYNKSYDQFLSEYISGTFDTNTKMHIQATEHFKAEGGVTTMTEEQLIKSLDGTFGDGDSIIGRADSDGKKGGSWIVPLDEQRSFRDIPTETGLDPTTLERARKGVTTIPSGTTTAGWEIQFSGDFLEQNGITLNGGPNNIAGASSAAMPGGRTYDLTTEGVPFTEALTPQVKFDFQGNEAMQIISIIENGTSDIVDMADFGYPGIKFVRIN